MESSGITAITTGMSNATTLVESALTAILGNGTLMVIMGGGFVGFSLRILRKFFKTSRSVG